MQINSQLHDIMASNKQWATTYDNKTAAHTAYSIITETSTKIPWWRRICDDDDDGDDWLESGDGGIKGMR